MRSSNSWIELCESKIVGRVPGGRKSNVYTTRFTILGRLLKFGIDLSGKTIIDYGCGNGRLAMALSETIFDVDYYGVDIRLPCVEFCRDAFLQTTDKFHFCHLDIHSDHYWKSGSIKPEDARLPFISGFADIIFSNSVYTHIYPISACIATMKEARRVLKDDGNFVATWLKSPPHKVRKDEVKTIYPIEVIEKAYKAAGFKWLESYGGETTQSYDQLVVHAVKL